MITGLHLEPTNKCTLKCSRCSRTEFISRFPNSWRNKDLDLEAFKQFFDLENLIIVLSGNYGDPIYYPDLFELLRFLKSKKCFISLHTNGSYHNKDWWAELGNILDENDRVTFAIDGLPDNFTQYRVNADWESMKVGIDTLKDYPVQLIWQYILFKYNEDQIEEAKELSKQFGFDEFFVMSSSRFNHENDPLIPTQGRNEVSVNKINWTKNRTIELDPMCKKDTTHHYISADGYYTPCCWSGEHRFYYKSTFWKNKDLYNIKNTTLSALLDSKPTQDFYNNIETDQPDYCTFNCPKL